MLSLFNMQSAALRLFSNDTAHRFAHLTSDTPELPALPNSDLEIMWSLVDYSTMSNSAQLARINNNFTSSTNDSNHEPTTAIFPVDTTDLGSWYDFFGSGGANDLELMGTESFTPLT